MSLFHAGISPTVDVQGRALCPGSTPDAPLLLYRSRWSILYSGVRGQENRGKMTATEIYESMDACMEENKGKEYREVLLDIRVHAAKLGRSVGRTEDDILSFYFKMRRLGK